MKTQPIIDAIFERIDMRIDDVKIKLATSDNNSIISEEEGNDVKTPCLEVVKMDKNESTTSDNKNDNQNLNDIEIKRKKLNEVAKSNRDNFDAVFTDELKCKIKALGLNFKFDTIFDAMPVNKKKIEFIKAQYEYYYTCKKCNYESYLDKSYLFEKDAHKNKESDCVVVSREISKLKDCEIDKLIF